MAELNREKTNQKHDRIWVFRKAKANTLLHKNKSKFSFLFPANKNSPLELLVGQCEDPETRYQHSWWYENRATVAADCVSPRRDGNVGALPLEQF